jgi:hypothetical protein
LVRELVLDDPAPFVAADDEQARRKEIDYEAKTVMLAGRRYTICRNRQEDAADRASIVTALERQLAKGDKAVIGNTGFLRYLKTISDEHFAIDADRSRRRGSSTASSCCAPTPISIRSRPCSATKQLWTVEQTFRTAKHLLSTDQSSTNSTRPFAVTCFAATRAGAKALEDRIAALGRLRRGMAGDHRPSGFADPDRNRLRRQTLRHLSGAAPGRQLGPAGLRRRTVADRLRRSGVLILAP